MPMDNPALPDLRDIYRVVEQQERNFPIPYGPRVVLDQAVHILVVVAPTDKNNISV